MNKFQRILYERGVATVNGSGLYRASNPWYHEKTIKLFIQEGVSETERVDVLRGSIKSLQQSDLSFRIINFGVNPASSNNIENATNSKGFVDVAKLGGILVSEPYRDPEKGEGYIPHADILIIRNPRKKDMNRSRDSGGFGTSRDGNVIIWKGTEAAAYHQMGHLLGIRRDHSDKIDCGMGYPHKSLNFFCDKCMEGIYYFWKGLGEASEIDFFN